MVDNRLVGSHRPIAKIPYALQNGTRAPGQEGNRVAGATCISSASTCTVSSPVPGRG